MPNVEVSPALTRVAMILMLGACLYLAWTGFYNARHHPPAAANAIEEALANIDDPETVTVTQGAKLFDRGSTLYVQKYYVSKESPQQITQRYVSEFQRKGWRPMGGISDDDYASEFCKDKLLGTLYFYRVSNAESTFSLTIRTGGTAIDICG